MDNFLSDGFTLGAGVMLICCLCVYNFSAILVDLEQELGMRDKLDWQIEQCDSIGGTSVLSAHIGGLSFKKCLIN